MINKDDWQPVFLDKLRQSVPVRTAAAAVGINKNSIYTYRRNDPAFAAAWDAAARESRCLRQRKTLGRATGYQYDQPPDSVAAAVGNIGIALAWGATITGHDVYIIRESWRQLYKVGRTTDVKNRVATIQSGMPQSIELVALFKTKRSRALETFIHQTFCEQRYRGEWFALSAADLAEVVDVYRAFCASDGDPVDYWLAE